MKWRKVLGKKGEDMLKSWHKSLCNCIQNCKKRQSQFKKISETTKAFNEDSWEELCFIAGWKCLEKIEQSKDFLEKNTVKVERLFYDQSYSCMEQYLIQLSDLKKFLQRTSHEISVQIPSDSTVCDIRYACVFPDGHIPLADNNNSKLKLLDK
ncbi:hypothetical protein DPMN_067105 [Dreissena polymorpha]|uniref:Uncharacterized protein n=1 Tax=Dreissena polymorpha TaxID=45954 RepID=A0A9D3YXG2_DREPO|nr:hypothetical protein DPMN_067105 [Dreissena polymorpha]